MKKKDLAALPFTLRQLDLFMQLCEFGSFKDVGEALGISQASVSSQIKALEGQLGLRLLDRVPGKSTRPTHEGAEFLADLVLFRESALRLSSHGRRGPAVESSTSVQLTAFISQYIFNRLLRPKLARFLDQNPDLDLNISAEHFDMNPAERLSRADHDFILLHESDAQDLPPHTKRVATFRCGVFGHRDFLQSLSTPVVPPQLNELPFVLPSKGSYFENNALRELADHGIRPRNIVRRAQHFDIIATVLESGKAVGRMLEPLLSYEQREKVVMLYPMKSRRLSLYRNPRCTGPEADALEEFLVSVALTDPAYRPAASEELPEHRASELTAW